MNAPSPPQTAPSFKDAFRVFLRIGFLSFGGPAAQIALMHKELVADRQWIRPERWSTALGFCMLLPGPEAMQLQTYAGWRLHGVWGGIAAGLAFVLPGALVVLASSAIYALYGEAPAMAALFFGLQAAVLAVVAQALGRMAQKALDGPLAWGLAAAAFAALFFFAVPFPLVIAIAAAIGALAFTVPEIAGHHEASRPVVAAPLRTTATWLAVWWAPILAFALFDGGQLFFDIGVFFSKLAIVTFGGAYAVLAYMAQEVVTELNWMDADAMATGLGLAETTPGPLILVTEFTGFVAAYNEIGTLQAAVLGAGVALWATFAPCFLWIFLGAPYLDRLGGKPKIEAALKGVSAAVAGVIANLSLWFALHVLFDEVGPYGWGVLQTTAPTLSSFDWPGAAVAALAAFALFRLRWGVPAVLALAAGAGLALSFFGLIG